MNIWPSRAEVRSALSSPWSHLSCFLDFILCEFAMLTTLLPALCPQRSAAPLRTSCPGSSPSTCPRDPFLLEPTMPSLHLSSVLSSQHVESFLMLIFLWHSSEVCTPLSATVTRTSGISAPLPRDCLDSLLGSLPEPALVSSACHLQIILPSCQQ